MFAMTHLSESHSAFLAQLETYLLSNTVVKQILELTFWKTMKCELIRWWMDLSMNTAVATDRYNNCSNSPDPSLHHFGNLFLQVRTHAHPPSLSSKILDYIDASSTLAERGVSSSPTQVLLCECLCLCKMGWDIKSLILLVKTFLSILNKIAFASFVRCLWLSALTTRKLVGESSL